MHSVRRAARAAALSVLLAAPGAVMAQTFVTPTTPETSGLSTPLRSLPRQYMAYYDETQINVAGVDKLITGMRLRISSDSQPSIGAPGPAVTWPPAPRTFSSFQVQISEASSIVTGAVGGAQFPNTTQPWAAYQDAPTVTTVYNSGLTIPAGGFQYTSDGTNNPGPNPFGFTINFATPYVYTPGEELVLYIKHSGFGGTDNVFFANADFAAEVADAVAALDNTAATPTGGFSSPVIFEFVYTDIPEPTGLAVLGLAAAGMLLRRRA